MKRTPIIWRTFALLVAATAACGSEPQSESAVATAPPANADETATPPIAAAPEAVVPPPAASSPSLPLENLLQLPAATAQRPAEPDINEVLNREPAEAPAEAEETASERKLRLEIEARTEAPIEHRDVKREQLDAGAKLDVSKDTSIRGAVRVERDTSGSKAPNVGATPNIGIEKRF